MDLSVIIVSWKVKEKLRANLQALDASEGDFSYEVYVVDNNSGDGSVEMVRAEFPQVKLLANDDNRGFAKANNQALIQVQGDYVLLLNPDMLVRPDTLINALTWAKNNQQAVVSGYKLVDSQGKIIKQVRRFPSFFDQLMIISKIPHLLPGVLSHYLWTDFNYEQAAKVDSIRGAFFLINKKVYLNISGQKNLALDERYFIWFEEVDFCRQVFQNGGEVWYSPAAQCVDYVGASFGQVALATKQKYFEDSMLKYFKKWEAIWQYYLLKGAWSLVNSLISLLAQK
ncbi:MAG: glycosyltransferase family 2 protein [Candidatus Falkowbacteria bacterium]